MTKKKGFTLVELLIGIICMSLVIVGITLGVRLGFDMFTKAQANAKVTNGVRFTVASFKRKMWPIVNKSSYIEILDKMPSSAELAKKVSNDCYIYYDSDERAVKYWLDQKTHTLEGSEYISSLDFSVPVSESEDKLANFLVKMRVEGYAEDHPTARTSVDIECALYARPSKSDKSNKVTVNGTEYYEGPVLHFEDNQDFVLKIDKIHLLNSADAVVDYLDVANGTPITVSYDLRTDPETDYTFTDASTYEWFLTLEPTVSPDKRGTDNPKKDSNGNAKTGWWQIVSSDGTTSFDKKTFPTEGMYEVKDSTGNKYSWIASDSKGYGALICRIRPALKKADGTIYYLPYTYSPYTIITKSTSSGTIGQKLWQNWTKGIVNNSTEGFFKAGNKDDVNVTHEINGGNTYVTVSRTTGGTGSSIIVATVSSDIMDEEQVYVTESDDNKAYTTVTNYSVIVDSQTDVENGGYGVLLNGASEGSSSTSFKDCGYVLQYDLALKAFPIRLYANGYNDYYYEYTNQLGATRKCCALFQTNTEDSRINADGDDKSDYFFSSWNSNSAGYAYSYRPAFLSNSEMDCNGTDAYRTNPFKGRTRMILTVLEYYTMESGKTKEDCMKSPKFIVRLRLLKNHSDVTYSAEQEKKDPWHIGPAFYKSEPAWFGNFVGDAPANLSRRTINPYKNKWTYEHTPVNYSDVSRQGTYFYGNSKPSEAKNRYITRGKGGRSGCYATIFDALEMDVSKDVKAYDSSSGPTNTDNQRKTKDAFEKPMRNRYLGVRLWGTDTTATKFYSINYAPGFRKSELQAIMPSGAKMYELSDTLEPALKGVDQTELNKSLFGSTEKSSGSGGGVMSIQHVKGSCTCPLHLYDVR